ncbi:MAG: oligosaccharide flippase family protein [Thermoplasmata archaeon]|nr:oligosaccharide flippase family protein [Thermoplasmata archaeon]
MTDGVDDNEARTLRAVGKGASVMVVTTILLFVFAFVGRVAVARIFGAAVWGNFSIGLALTQAIALVAMLGLNQATAQMLASHRDPATRWGIIRTSLFWTSLGSVVASVAVFFSASELSSFFHTTNHPQLTLIFQMFSVTIGFTLMSLYLAAIFQGFENIVPNAWFNQVVNPGLFVVFLFLFLVLNLSFFGSILAYTVANGVAFGALAVYTVRRLPRVLPPASSVRRVKAPHNLWGLAVSLWGVTALAFVTTYVDTIILGLYKPSEVVGWYSSATTLARLLIIGSGALTYIYLPVAARLAREGDYATLRSSYVTTTRWTLVFTVPLFLLFAFLPDQSMGAVFGSSFVPGAAALAILTWGSIISVMFGPVNATQAGLGKGRILLVAAAVAASSNIALSFALIPTYGILGAAIAWTVARVVYPGVGLLALIREDHISPFQRSLLLPMGVALGIGLPLFIGVDLLEPHYWIVFPMYFVGAIVFVFALFATRSLHSGDLLVARHLERLVGRPMPKLWTFLERFVETKPAAAVASTATWPGPRTER